MGLKTDKEDVTDNKYPSTGSTAGHVAASSSKPLVIQEGLVPKKAPLTSRLSKSPQHKKKTGVRQARRNDNDNFLLSLLDEDHPIRDPDITDFISSHQSAFEQLFLQQENMEIWSEFMNRSGEEQDRFLQEVEEGMMRVATKASLGQDKNGNHFSKVISPSATSPETTKEVQDKRCEHPAHTPQECFKRISSRLQTMLRRRHLPKGAVELHEDQLLSWFTDDPGSVFISTLPSSFDRLLLHGVCQYLDLTSESFENAGQRQTRVENNKEYFTPPAVLLSTYLDSLS